MTFHVRTLCQLCSGQLETVLDLGETPLANEYLTEPAEDQERFPLQLAHCAACGHVQMPVVVSPERLFSDYRYTSGTTATFRAHLAALARTIERTLDGPGLAVEIGSNDGTLLAELQMRGWRVIGVDPARNLAAQASNSGMLTIPAFFDRPAASSIRNIAGMADAVIALNVFAHAENLSAIASAARHVLAPTGVFVIEVGAVDSIFDGVFDLIYHEHLAFHHPLPLAAFMARHGFDLYRTERVDSQGGSYRFWCRPREVAEPTEVPQYDWETVRARVEQKREEIRGAVAAAGRVAMYGCPAKATTLLHYCGIQGAIDACYDDNPMKVGRYVPGTNIKIRPVSEMGQAETLLLCAWNFADEIMGRVSHRGRWIVPFPEVRVV